MLSILLAAGRLGCFGGPLCGARPGRRVRPGCAMGCLALAAFRDSLVCTSLGGAGPGEMLVVPGAAGGLRFGGGLLGGHDGWGGMRMWGNDGDGEGGKRLTARGERVKSWRGGGNGAGPNDL